MDYDYIEEDAIAFLELMLNRCKFSRFESFSFNI